MLGEDYFKTHFFKKPRGYANQGKFQGVGMDVDANRKYSFPCKRTGDKDNEQRGRWIGGVKMKHFRSLACIFSMNSEANLQGGAEVYRVKRRQELISL